MKKEYNISLKKAKEIFLTANAGEENKHYNFFIEEAFGVNFARVLMRDFRDFVADLFDREFLEIDITTEIYNSNKDMKITIEFIKFNGKSIEEEENLLYTEKIMIKNLMESLLSLDIEVVFNGFSLSMFEVFKESLGVYLDERALKKEKPETKGMLYHCLVYIFEYDSIMIEKEIRERNGEI